MIYRYLDEGRNAENHVASRRLSLGDEIFGRWNDRGTAGPINRYRVPSDSLQRFIFSGLRL